MVVLLRLLLLCLWPLGPLSASEILLVGRRPAGHPQLRRRPGAAAAPRSCAFPDQRTAAPGASSKPTAPDPARRPALEWRLGETAGPPALAMRVSRVQAEQRLGKSRPAFLSLLWSDPPLARQLRLARYLLPQARRIGVLYGEHSSFLLDELRQAAAPGPGDRRPGWDDPRDSRPLQNLLANSDVLLGLDDPDLYNSKTAKNLLLSSYGRQMALIGPNAGFVRAGALASTYSDQDDWLAVLDHLLDQPPRWPRSLYPNASKSVATSRWRAPWASNRSIRTPPPGVGRRRTHPMSKRLSWDITPAPRSSASALPCC
jgi:hypothetical protein